MNTLTAIMAVPCFVYPIPQKRSTITIRSSFIALASLYMTAIGLEIIIMPLILVLLYWFRFIIPPMTAQPELLLIRILIFIDGNRM
jgi:hypothetical protein